MRKTKARQPKTGEGYHRLTWQKIELIFKLREDAHTQQHIADTLRISVATVCETLQRFASTVDAAKRLAKTAAEPLTRRVIEKADVDQCLEVLDRLEVLPKRVADGGGSQIQILVGGPGHPAGPDPWDTVIDVGRGALPPKGES